MAQQFENDSFMQLIRQTLLKDEYKEKFTSLILSALFECKETQRLNCDRKEICTKETSTQTELTNEEVPIIDENSTEDTSLNMRPNNEEVDLLRKKEHEKSYFPTQNRFNRKQYSFDPYCTRILSKAEDELFWDEQRERSQTRTSSSSRSRSRSSTGSRSSLERRRSSRSSSRTRSSSRSSRRRRRASPSFRESRRITSARRMPVPYTRSRPEGVSRWTI